MKTLMAQIIFALLLCAPAMAQDARITLDRPGHREWAWDGGDGLGVGGAMTVRVVPGGPARVVMTGPEDLVRHAYLRRGDLGIENRGWNFSWGGRDRIEVTISGVSLSAVSVSGSSQVTLEEALRQRDLQVQVSGSGRIAARGRVEHLEARVSGSGSLRLDGLTARQGDIRVSGSGTVEVGAVEQARADVSGSGSVRIRERPRALDHSISGSGQVVAGGESFTRRNRR